MTRQRRCRLLLTPDAAGPGLLAVWTRRTTADVYWLSVIPAGYRLTKFRSATSYTLRRVAAGRHCSCRAASFGRACKHLLAVSALVNAGRLRAVPALPASCH